MHYEYLKKWVEENSVCHLVVQAVQRCEDQYRLIFRKSSRRLQICLSNDSFCFFTERDSLPFAETRDLYLFNRHLADSQLNDICLSPTDRIIILPFRKLDIFNQNKELQLILELIPRFQNIILTQEGKIIDCLKKVSFAESNERQLLPGLPYLTPATQFEPVQKPVVYPLSINENLKIISCRDGEFDNMNAAFEALYYEGIRIRKIRQKEDAQRKALQKKIEQKKKKLEKLQNELQDVANEEIWKKRAELLKANLGKLKSGLTSTLVTDYYDPALPEIEIILDEKKSPRQNMEYYFKKYRKARDGKAKIAEQIGITKREIVELENVCNQIQPGEIQAEISHKKARQHSSAEKIRKLKIDEKWEILLGGNNRENDLISTQLAKPQDWWFHTRVFRGAHVVLRNHAKRELPENLKILCCRLAAYYSKAKKSSNVPVDYTQIRYVRKPRGAAPGFVTYSNQKTIFVDPLSLREAARILDQEK